MHYMQFKSLVLALLLLSLTLQDTAPTKTKPITYDYTTPSRKRNTNSVTLTLKGAASATNIVVVANFQPTLSSSPCFKDSQTRISVAPGQYLFATTLQSSKAFDLSGSCQLKASNQIISGVSVPIIYGVTVDDKKAYIQIPCAGTGCKNPGGTQHVVGGYYPNWSVYSKQFDPLDIPYQNLDQLFYAFLDLNPATGDVVSMDKAADNWGLSAVAKSGRQYPYLETYLSFGGGTDAAADKFTQLTASQASIDKFAAKAVNLVQKLGFSGIDIDWEWWTTDSYSLAPAKNFLRLMKCLRKSLDSASAFDHKIYKLTIAVSGSSKAIQALQNPKNPNSMPDFWAQIGKTVHQLNVMNYAYHQGTNIGTPAYFQANFDFPNVNGSKVGTDQGWSIKSSTDAYISLGVPPSLIVVGLPLYGRTMKVSQMGKFGGLFQPITGPGKGDFSTGVVDTKCLANPVVDASNGCVTQGGVQYVKGITQFYNSQNNVQVFNSFGRDAFQPWAFNRADSSFFTFEDQWSVSQKAKMAKQSGMKGVMFWSIDSDLDDKGSLIAQAATSLS